MDEAAKANGDRAERKQQQELLVLPAGNGLDRRERLAAVLTALGVSLLLLVPYALGYLLSDSDIQYTGLLITSLIGSLALIGFPGFAGFYSKDAIIEAVHASTLPGAGIAYLAVLLGVFVTALYSFRMYFLVFHGEEPMDAHTREHLHETPWVVTLPLVLLAIPSVIIGWMYVEPALFGDLFGPGNSTERHIGRDIIAHLIDRSARCCGFLLQQ